MFGHQQLVTVEDVGKVRKKDKRQEDKSFLQDIKLSCPLTPELAEDFDPRQIETLWRKRRGGKLEANPALSSSSIPLRLTLQILTVTAHPDHDPFARIEGVGIKAIRATKIEGDNWILTWKCVVPYDENSSKAWVMCMNEGVYVTFEAMQGNFLEDEKPKRAKKVAAADEEEPELEELDDAADEAAEPPADETPAQETRRNSRARRRAVAPSED